MKLFRSPLFHFVLIGAVILAVVRSLPQARDTTPFTVSEVRIEALNKDWLQKTGRLPNAAELDGLIKAEIDDEILFREAIQLKLHRQDLVVKRRLIKDMKFLNTLPGASDEDLLEEAYRIGLTENNLVVRRRLVQLMETVLTSTVDPSQWSDESLFQVYEKSKRQWQSAPQLSFRHLFFSKDKHGDEAQQLAAHTAESLRTDGSWSSLLAQSDLFIGGTRFHYQIEKSVSKNFGPRFAQQLFAAKQGEWLDAMESPFGFHVVFIEEKIQQQQLPFEAVKGKLRNQLFRKEKRQVLANTLGELRIQFGLSL